MVTTLLLSLLLAGDDIKPGTGGPAEPEKKIGADLPELIGPVERAKIRERMRKRKNLTEARDLQAGEVTDTLEKLLRGLDDARELLKADLNTGKETQRRQDEAVALLDKLIDEAVRSAQQSQDNPESGGDPQAGKSKPQAGKPEDGPVNQGAGAGTGSSAAAGEKATKGKPEGVAGAGATGAMMKAWGNLPPKLREQVVTGVSEKSHPDYQKLVESFFTRLGNLRGEE